MSCVGPDGNEMHKLADSKTSTLWIANDGIAYRRYYNTLTQEYEWANQPTLPNCDDKGRMYLCVGTTRVLLDDAISRVWKEPTFRNAEDAKTIDTKISPRIIKAVECLRACEPVTKFASRCNIKKGTAWSYLHDAAQHESLEVLERYIFSHIHASLLIFLDALSRTKPALLGGPLTQLVCHCDKMLELTEDKYGAIRLARYFIMQSHQEDLDQSNQE